MTVRLLKLPAVLRYAAIFWAFYELFMVIEIVFGSRTVMQGAVARIALYALACGTVNLLFTMALFGALDVLNARTLGKPGELAALLLVLCMAVLLMMSTDAALRVWFDAAPIAQFSGYWFEILQTQFHDSLITLAFLAGLGNALRSWAGEDERKIRESDVRTDIARSEIEAVAAHLRPAVVAEALREIGAAVERDPVRARTLTLELANTLRASFGR
jgi:hypothetical protein